MNNRKKSATLTLLCTLVRVQTGLQSHRTTHSIRTTMARTRNALKRQKVASSSIQSALFSPDVAFLLATHLDAGDLREISLTCKALGGKQAAYEGLSLVEEVVRQMFECASDWERSCLLKYDDEGWIEHHRHLLRLRSKLTFDLPKEGGVRVYDAGGLSAIRNTVPVLPAGSRPPPRAAICRDYVMRGGSHFAVFSALAQESGGGHGRFFNDLDRVHGGGGFGVVRPVQFEETPFFRIPGMLGSGMVISSYIDNNLFLAAQRTVRWGDSHVHCCHVDIPSGNFSSYDWVREPTSGAVEGFQRDEPLGLHLDLEAGTLTLYQDGRRVAMLKDGLSGQYCWFGAVYKHPTSIRRSSLEEFTST